MRWLSVGLICLALAGCGKAPDANGPGEASTTASGVAFSFRYDFRLPSSRIADAQEAQARACEQLAAQCRITGMTYHVDEAGQVAASLAVRVAAPLARAFGRRGVQAVEGTGGVLTGAEIIGTDAEPAIDAATANSADAGVERASIDRELARGDLPPEKRAELSSRRLEVLRAQRANASAAIQARESVSLTPISFAYHAGSGVGMSARLSEASQAAYRSLTTTLVTVLTLIAYLGPPLVLLFLLAVLWHRFGRRWVSRAFGPREPE
jgi:hypothetical protein